MTSESGQARKRFYASPVLVNYGTMVALTKNGTGSRLENKKSRSKNKRA